MVWKLEAIEREQYERNTLVAVIGQLQFAPILKINDYVPDFQDAVRQAFPSFEEVLSRTADIDLTKQSVQVRDEKQNVFANPELNTRLVLTPHFLSLETRSYRSREEFFEQFDLALKALTSTYKAVSPTRIGLRYINEINKDILERENDEPLAWKDLINEAFLTIPGKMADLEHTAMFSEINSPIQGGGHMTVRYGLAPRAKGELCQTFRLDVDRYQEHELPIENLIDLLKQFSNDTYAVFRQAVGPQLVSWMNVQEGQS